MSTTIQGIAGEKLAREIILKHIKPDLIQQLDWVFKFKDKWFSVEVKNKESFKTPPFEGQGLNIKQINLRMQFQKDTGIRCLFLTMQPDTNIVYYQWLDWLNNNPDPKCHHDTRNGIRIFNYDFFKKFGG